jgi:hypothetical protein
MKRNFDVVRAILLEVEAWPPGGAHFGTDLVLEGYERADAIYHLQLLIERGLLEGHSYPVFHSEPLVRIVGMTWAGHDWLDKMRNDTVWKRINDFLRSKGIAASFEILDKVATHYIEKRLHLPGV